MPAIERFEDIQAWQKARVLDSACVTRTTGERSVVAGFRIEGPGSDEQPCRSCQISPRVLREAGDNEFHRFLGIARVARVAEVQSQLYVGTGPGLYQPGTCSNDCSDQADEMSRHAYGFHAGT